MTLSKKSIMYAVLVVLLAYFTLGDTTLALLGFYYGDLYFCMLGFLGLAMLAVCLHWIVNGVFEKKQDVAS